MLIDKVVVQPYEKRDFQIRMFGPDNRWRFDERLIDVLWKV